MTQRAFPATMTLLVLAAVVVVGVVVVLNQEKDEAVEANRSLSETSDRAGIEAVAQAPVESPDPVPADVRERIEPAGVLFSGRVKDRESGQPLPEFSLRLVREDRRQQTLVEVFDEEVLDPDGRFSFRLERHGIHLLFADAPGHREQRVLGLEIPAGGLAGYEIDLPPALAVTGRVVDDHTGDPVEGAVVGALHYSGGRILRNDDVDPLDFDERNRTDGNGSFTLRGLRDWPYLAIALHPDFREGFAEARPGTGEVEIRLERSGFRIYGLVRDDDGDPVEGINIVVTGEPLPQRRVVQSDAEGNYSSPPLAGGWYFVKACDPDRLQRKQYNYWKEGEDFRNPGRNFTSEVRQVHNFKRDERIDFGPSANHVTWRGRLIGTDGKPVPGGEVNVQSAASKGTLEPMCIVQAAFCGRDGGFEIRKLVPDTYLLGVKLPGQSSVWPVQCEDMVFDSPGIFVRDIVLVRTEIRGVVVDSRTGKPPTGSDIRVVAEREGATRVWRHAQADREGRFVLPNLPAGTYTLTARVPRRFKARLEGIDVIAGKVHDGIRMVVPRDGELLLRFSGFGELVGRGYTLTLTDAAGGRNSFGSSNQVPRASWQMKMLCIAGPCTLSIAVDGLGTVERFFGIEDDGSTEIRILGSEFPAN